MAGTPDINHLVQLLEQLVNSQASLVQRVLNLEKQMALIQTDFDQKLAALVAIMAQLQAVVNQLAAAHAVPVDLTTEGMTVDQLAATATATLNAATAALSTP